jgi:hypothetical protein
MDKGVLEIVWAAGLYEGEGSAWRRTRAPKRDQVYVEVGQKERWVLDKLKVRFGGSICLRKARPEHNNPNPLWRWSLTARKARGFLMTIYVLLSPHRQAQIRHVLAR